MKQIVLCADDFGQNEAISQGIIQLIEQGVLSAVSCMTNMPDWQRFGVLLKPYQEKVDIGLHFNLTHGRLLSTEQNHALSLKQIILATHLKKIKACFIQQELEQQLNRFVEVTGRLPDFIDGHQHIQHLPVIREVLIRQIRHLASQHAIYVRAVAPEKTSQLLTRPARLKNIVLYMTGGKAFKAQLKQAHIPYNQDFAGVYHFEQTAHYRKRFQRFLATIRHDGLIMCHPGLPGEDKSDPIAHSRSVEWQYFMSEDFSRDCQRYQVMVERFSQIKH